MCGIFGYVGQETDAGVMVLDALRRLEYRGYDSWGVGVSVNGHIAVQKEVGKIGLATVDFPSSAIGFGHTRWATHGGVTRANAHPHLNETDQVAVVHNGIIENYRDIKRDLTELGYTFQSETDSELVAHLLTEQLPECYTAGDILEAVRMTFARLQGLNAIIVMDRPTQTLTAVKTVSPLVLGRNAGGFFVASDQVALAGKADEVCYLEDGQVAQFSANSLIMCDQRSGEPVGPDWRPLQLAIQSTNRDGFAHYMIKEVHEQPVVVERVADELLEGARGLAAEIMQAYGTFLLGCGTASYAALTGSYLFSRIAQWHVNFVVGSEFGYYEHFLTNRSLVTALSQSGETADIIQSVLTAKHRGSRIAALVNTQGSTLDRIADFRVHLRAGPELSVLSTKAYSAKVALLLLTAHIISGTEARGQQILRQAAASMRQALEPAYIDQIQEVANSIIDRNSMFVIGRGLNYPTALEAALKIKEVSYIHAEGFAGGELKHGVIALIEEGTPCLVFAPSDETRPDILSGAMEMRARGGYIIGVSSEPDDVFDVHLPVTDVGDANPLAMVIPAQLLGYYLALKKGYDPDKPRNLAKSVTVK